MDEKWIVEWFYAGAKFMWPDLTMDEFGHVARLTAKLILPGDRWSLQRMNDELINQLTLKKGPPKQNG